MKMKLFRIAEVLAGITFFMLLLTGSVPTKKVTEPEPVRVAPNFDFKPPEEGVKKSKDISLILLKPTFDNEYLKNYRGAEPDRTFIDNMESDFEEMINARGYILTTVSTYEELVYAQKKNSDMVMKVEFTWKNVGVESAIKYSDVLNPTTKQTTRKYWYDGPAHLGGRMEIRLSEPFTQEKVWIKALNLPPHQVYLKTYYRYESNGTSLYIPETDPVLWNILVPVMEKMYTQALEAAWNHLDPEELKVKKDEANEIKKNSGYLR